MKNKAIGALILSISITSLLAGRAMGQFRQIINSSTVYAEHLLGCCNGGSHSGPIIAQSGGSLTQFPFGTATSSAVALSTNIAGTTDIPQASASSISTSFNIFSDGMSGISGASAQVQTGGRPNGLPNDSQYVFLYLAANSGGTFPSGTGIAQAGNFWIRADGDHNGWDVSIRFLNANNMIEVETQDDAPGVNRLMAFPITNNGCNSDVSALADTGAFQDNSLSPLISIVSAAWSFCVPAGTPIPMLSSSLVFNDFNRDGVLDSVDIDSLAASSRTMGGASDISGDGIVDFFDGVIVSPMYDLNQDQRVTFGPSGASTTDSDLLILDAMNTFYGDANLDGVVDGLDFIAWNDNKFTSGTTWSQGDFNGNGITDGDDFIIWAANNGQSNRSAIAVPESSNREIEFVCVISTILMLRMRSLVALSN